MGPVYLHRAWVCLDSLSYQLGWAMAGKCLFRVRSGRNAEPKNGLLFEVDRTSSLLTSANHPKAVVYLRGAECRCLAISGRCLFSKEAD